MSLIPGWVKLIAVVGALVALVVAVNYHDGTIRKEARAERDAYWKPQVDTLTLNQQKLQEGMLLANTALEKLAAARAKIEADKKNALAKVAALETEMQPEIERLRKIAYGPVSANEKEACDEATRLMRQSAAGSLRSDTEPD